ncbi:pectate lyase [Ferruginibacter sp. SUN106]|uniref:pectate lyase n=1 Tax=Ferruginibacter sp. SUN106 TaxID=2978348 RepID=UPI003D36389D
MNSIKKLILILAAVTAVQFGMAQTTITVAQDGSGNFRSIQEAINSLPKEDNKIQRVISVKNGTYKEKIFIDNNFITLRGENPEQTIVTISLAREEWRCDNKDDYGVAAINLRGSDIVLENISFLNTFGKDNTADKEITCAEESTGKKTIKPYGHQMALRSFNTTRLIVKNCIFRAWGGDTVSPWNTDEGMFYFKDCIMEGGVDFYCPRGWALAENCTFICHDKNAAIWHDGSKYEKSKTVLLNCKFSGDDGFKLGRYHRDAQFYLLNCSFAKNMADADIYLVPTENKIQWGRRIYYYNCKREGGKDYAWYKNNLPADFGINEFNEPWVYDYKWNPLKSEKNKEESAAMAATATGLVVGDATDAAAKTASDPIADKMLIYQRKNGGWPKHFQGNRNVDYKRVLNDVELKELRSGYDEGIDATIDNEATTKEIKYLVKAYKAYKNEAYLKAAEQGIDYLLKAQYANGGWPQYYPDFSSYRSQVTYNDNAMINVLNVLQNVVLGKNDFDVIDKTYIEKCNAAIKKGIDCIIKTQIKQKGKLTAWCAQYNAKTLVPETARKFELASLSGSESVGIVRFLMQQPDPSKEIITAVNAAVEWFEKVKIVGYNFVEVKAPNEASGKDKVLVKDDNAVIWARFYNLEINEPFFTGRDSQPKKTIAEVENERRIGYAWYGVWPENLIHTEYPKWVEKWKVKK